MLEAWMRSYRPEELFDDDGRAASRACSRWRPTGTRRMGANPHANGGELLRDLALPDFRDYAVDVPAPGAAIERGDPRARRASCATSMRRQPARRSALFGPDETASNRLGAVFEVDRPRLDGRRSSRATTTSRPTAA